MSELRCVLPVAPSVNNAYSTRIRWTDDERPYAVRVLSEEAEAFKAEAGIMARNAAQLAGWDVPAKARLSLSLRIWFKGAGRRDLDNCVKLAQDALSEALGFDDRYVDHVEVDRMGVDRKNPRCEITLVVLT
jgi:Holliday junction resolvase RusA-like endonuclease